MRILLILLTVILGTVFSSWANNVHKPIPVKVVIVTTFLHPFPSEAGPWFKNENLSLKVPIPGLKYKYAFCRPSGELCLIISGEGEMNMSASIMALGLSRKLDLRNSFFILSGTAGGDPNSISLGSVSWANWIINGDLVNAIAQSELPANLKYPFFRIGCTTLWCHEVKKTFKIQSVKLNTILVQRVFNISKKIKLRDSEKIKCLREEYHQVAVKSPPKVYNCDNLTTNFYWVGNVLNDWANAWVKAASNNQGNFCTSSMEDSAFILALNRLHKAGLVNSNRALSLRAISDLTITKDKRINPITLFDHHPAQAIAVENLYIVASFVANYIIENWTSWNTMP